MKKVKQVFEGVVNGKVFTTVEEYNAAIEEALKSNTPLRASTTTKTVEVEEEKSEKPEDVEVADFHNLEGIDFLPFINPDDVTDDNRLNTILDRLEDIIYNDVNTLLESGSDDLKRYLKEVEPFITENDQRLTNTDSAIESLEDKLEEINSQLDTLYRAYDVLSSLDHFYDTMKSSVEEELKNRKTVESRFKKLLQDIGLA